jgi:hypothetical protein
MAMQNDQDMSDVLQQHQMQILLLQQQLKEQTAKATISPAAATAGAPTTTVAETASLSGSAKGKGDAANVKGTMGLWTNPYQVQCSLLACMTW